MLTDLESEVSVTDPDSEIYKINQDGTGTLTGNAGNLMQEALEMCRRTDGALDISVYPIVRAWGFTTEEYQVLRKQRLNPFSRLLIIQRSNMILLQEMYPFQKE